MPEPSQFRPAVNLLFFRDAASIYGDAGLAPATANSVGVDLRACCTPDHGICIPAGMRHAVPTGVAIEPLVPHVAGFVYSRSGLGAKTGLTVAQGVGVIDPDYRGEIIVFLLNTSDREQTVKLGDRIAQLVLQPYIMPSFQVVSTLSSTQRGEGGFGHTGRQ